MKKLLLLLLLPLTLLFVVGCGGKDKLSGLERGDQIIFGYTDGNGREKVIGGGANPVWLTTKKTRRNTIYYRDRDNLHPVDKNYEFYIPNIAWIEKHSDQLPMPPLSKYEIEWISEMDKKIPMPDYKLPEPIEWIEGKPVFR